MAKNDYKYENSETGNIVKKLLLENEVKSNYLVANANLLFAFVLSFFLILEFLHVFGAENFNSSIAVALFAAIFICIINSIITYALKGKKPWIKFFNLFSFSLSIAIINMVLSYNVIVLISLPVILSSRYFSKRIVRTTAIGFGLLWIISAYVGEYFNFAWVDLNYYEPLNGAIINVQNKHLYDAVIEAGINTASRISEGSFRVFIQIVLYSVICVICVSITRTGQKLILRMAEEQMDKARISAELNIASKIQSSMLPNASPALPDHKEFTLYASMTPAKEVGGDFYDFYMIDDDRLALIMADVSGKGVPAALFMVIAKTIIKNVAMYSKLTSTAQILKTANKQLCERNDESYFVTVWMAIINIRTGKGIATNAGHENPAIKRANDPFELITYEL